MTSRIVLSQDTYVYWNCKGRDDVSRVRDLSPRGLFIETRKQFPASTEAKLHFLVEEGEINAHAVVCHTQSPRGLGLKFVSVREEHHRRLAALINRLRSLGVPIDGLK